MFTFTRKIATMVIGIIVALGLTVNVAFADTTATFTSSFNGTASAAAKAKAVAIGEADATGKILLEELRAQIPQSIQDKWKTPTKEQIVKYGTLVHSLPEAQAVLTEQVKAYDQAVNKARVKIAKLKLRIKHKDGNVPKLKKKLKKAKKALKAIYVDKDWKYRPLIGLDRGVCFRNSGLLGNLVLQSFVDCVDGDKASVWIGFNPVMREMRIVAVVKLDGSVEDGCLNIPFFDIPPGTPDRSLFIVVKSFVSLKLKVKVGVNVSGTLTVYGEMKQNGVTCDTDSKSVSVNQTGKTEEVEVTGMDMDKAIAFAENKVQASASAKAEAVANVQTSVQVSVSQTMTLSCPTPNHPPTCELVQYPAHVYVSLPGQVPNRYRFKVVWSDPDEQLTRNSATVTVTGQAFIVKNNPDFPEIWDTEGTQVVYTGWLEAKQQTGNATLSVNVTDSQGATCSQSRTFPIVPDDF